MVLHDGPSVMGGPSCSIMPSAVDGIRPARVMVQCQIEYSYAVQAWRMVRHTGHIARLDSREQEMDRWKLPIVGYVTWWLLRGKTPEQIKEQLDGSDVYPRITAEEWQEVYAAGRADAEATLHARRAGPHTKIGDLWPKNAQQE